MKKMIILLWISLMFPSIICAQERVVVPVWNVGDKWVFTQGNVEVVGADQNSYTLNFSKDTCRIENKGLIIFDKSTLNRIYAIKEDKRSEYTLMLRRILNFPFNPGKEWKDNVTFTQSAGPLKGTTINVLEEFKILGWEDVRVQAGNFKTVKLEFVTENRTMKTSGKHIYWYAPEAKYFVKCQYDKLYFLGVDDWELVSFNLQK